MKLVELFAIFKQWKMGDHWDKTVALLSTDSKSCDDKSVFIAVKGSSSDGHLFLNEVCDKNPIGIVVQKESSVPNSYRGAVVEVDSTREVLAVLASRFYHAPSDKLLSFGVTGTNGKTSVTLMLEKILNDHKGPTGVVGTIDHHLLNKVWDTHLTTPDVITLQKRLSDFVEMGAKNFVGEVSSHALKQGRCDGIHFNVAIFTNLTRDHLDYHKDFDDYFLSKQKLFLEGLENSKNPVAIINTDDEAGAQLKISTRAKVITYGQNDQTFSFRVLKLGLTSTVFEVQNTLIEVPLVGLHNVYNCVAALAASVAVGLSLNDAAQSLKNFAGVAGRLERVPTSKECHVFVDYAHTPDALEKVLEGLKAVAQKRILTVFGCGGDRDQGKRPLMTKAALQFSDVVILTSDNPRTEDPMTIIKDCLSGITSEVIIEVDRKKAIHQALQMANKNDVVLIAGKGHEQYQIIGKTRHPFSDVQVAKEFGHEMDA